MNISQFEILDPPADGITAALFSENDNNLLVSSWDSTVKVYNVEKNRGPSCSIQHRAAVLDCCWSDQDAFSACLDRSVNILDIGSQTIRKLGKHIDGVSCIEYSAATRLAISGSWDRTISLWDSRASTQPGGYDVGGKVFALAISPSGTKLVVATSTRNILIYDIRNISVPEQEREACLKHQIRAVKVSQDEQGFVLGSIEGRVAVEYFNLAEQEKKYAFKCHRKTTPSGLQEIYPVNSIAVHPRYGTFATGGCDGHVNMWDGDNKKRICQLPEFPSSVASLDFNRDGSLLAIASSYTFELGEREGGANQIFIRKIQESDVMPKMRRG